MAYKKNAWKSKDRITKEKLDNIEVGIEQAHAETAKLDLQVKKNVSNIQQIRNDLYNDLGNVTTVDDNDNFFYTKTYDQALAYLYNLINGMQNRPYYDNLVYSLPQPRTLNASDEQYIDTGVKLFDSETEPFTVLISFSNGSLNTAGVDAHAILHCMDEENWNGVSLAVNQGGVQVDYNHSSTRLTTNIFSNVGYNNGIGHTVILCKDYEKIRVYVDSANNYYDIIPSYYLTEPLYKNLMVGCYEDASGNKGRYWNGVIFDLKIWKECFNEYNVNALLGKQ